MRNQSLQEQLIQINRLLDTIPSDTTVQAHWGRYMCVLAAGFLENALHEVYKDYIGEANSANVERYASWHINHIYTPSSPRFLETAKRFSESWRTDLRAFIGLNGRREAIDTIMKNRNSIAHGGQSVISVSDVRKYLAKGVEVIDFIENQCLGLPQPNP